MNSLEDADRDLRKAEELDPNGEYTTYAAMSKGDGPVVLSVKDDTVSFIVYYKQRRG